MSGSDPGTSSTPVPGRNEATGADARGWLYHHIGRLAGVVLGFAAFLVVAFLAAIGFRPALGLLVVVVAFVAIIAIGGRMRGGR